MSDIIQSLPDVLPTEEIIVEDEQHVYESVTYDDGTTTERTEYVPNKAPFNTIRSIEGVVNGQDYTFKPDEDYQILDTDNDGRSDTIDFAVGGQRPDAGTRFTIDYRCESVLSRYIGSYGTELHTIESDIDRVIDSHYVDAATQCRPIDTFEDQQLVEYTFDSGGAPNATVQSDVVFNGDWALELNSACEDAFVRLVSQNGLTVYPQRGDYFVYHTRLGKPDDIAQFDFLYQNGNDVSQFYRIELDAGTQELSLETHQSGPSDTDSIAGGDVTDTWYRVDVTVSDSGPINVTVIDTETGDSVGSVSISDTQYTSGGIRWAASNPTCQSEVYVDTARVIDRITGDLDRIGSLFGELGRRRNRADDEYADYLKSIVGSFSGRGTVPGIKQAVATSIGMEPDDISIREDFTDNSYQVVFDTWPSHRGRTVETVAELADPSGIDHELSAYREPDNALTADEAIVLEGEVIDENTEATVEEIIVAITIGETSDGTAGLDAIESALTDRETDTGLGADAIRQTGTATVDGGTGLGADTVTITAAVVRWDQADWEAMYWD